MNKEITRKILKLFKYLIDRITLNSDYEKQLSEMHQPGHAEEAIKSSSYQIGDRISDWDYSNIVNMKEMFSSCSSITADISSWRI